MSVERERERTISWSLIKWWKRVVVELIESNLSGRSSMSHFKQDKTVAFKLNTFNTYIYTCKEKEKEKGITARNKNLLAAMIHRGVIDESNVCVWSKL